MGLGSVGARGNYACMKIVASVQMDFGPCRRNVSAPLHCLQ